VLSFSHGTVVLKIDLYNCIALIFERCKELFLHFKDDMQRFFTKLMQKSFLSAYCNINPSV